MLIHMIGNAHLDPIWLWSWQAGMDEALATFRSAADRCDEYPEFIYTRGEAWLYEQVERLDADLFARVAGLIADGRWRIVGGQYIQPDLNAPTAEALRRQFSIGQAYFRSRFGVSSQVAYNVDSFGHPACLPDILVACGIQAYMFRRPEPHQMRLPGTPFRWRGIGGAEVIAYQLPTTYLTGPNPPHARVQQVIDATAPSIGHGTAFYGVGNHGGGPTKGHIEWILAHRHHWPDVELRFSSPDAFFEAIYPLRDGLPVVEGDLQRCFPGCYSVMHDIKQNQRRNALLLESACGLSEAGASRADVSALEAAWKDVLFCDFHDIVTGTAARSAWSGVRAMQGRAQITLEETLAFSARRLARAQLPPVNEHQHVIFNPAADHFEGLVEIEPWLDFDSWRERWVADDAGRPLDFQIVQAESSLTSRLLVPVTVGARAAARVLIRSDGYPAAFNPGAIPTDLAVSPTRLANGRLQIDFDAAGIRQIRLDGAALLAGDGLRIQSRLDSGDTWVHHTDRFDEAVTATLSGGEWTVEETGPLRARLRYEGMLGGSRTRFTVSLMRGLPYLELQLEIMCQERYRLLQLALEMGDWVQGRMDGLALGAVARDADGREEPFQAWIRCAGADRALALATHDAYSVSQTERTVFMTLLRTPQMAWGGAKPIHDGGRRWFTDQGAHSFRFVLVAADPASASIEDGALRRHARDSALPPITFDSYAGLERPIARPSLPSVAGILFSRTQISDLLAEVGDRLPSEAIPRRDIDVDLGA